jgi:hypothetical protein
MLLNNYSYINSVLGRQFGGLTNPTKYKKPEVMRNYFSQPESGDIERVKRDSFPTGTNPPYSLVMGDKGGLISATTTISGVGTVSPYAVMGINMQSTLTGAGDLTSSSSLVAQIAAALSGSGDLSASASGLVQIAASLIGSGNVTVGVSMLVAIQAALNGGSSLDATMRGTADIGANIFVNSGTATTNDLVAAIWNAIAADNNNSGTMGQKLNGAGSAGDPWTTNLPASYADGQAGKILSQIQTLVDELHKIQGLSDGNPLTLTQTNRTAGTINLDLTGDGITNQVVTRND